MLNKSRGEKAFFNTVAGFADEFVTLICGLILPRLILKSFGSAYNGITSSISQFISCIALMKSGIGGVTRVALYKPLAEKDYFAVSAVVAQTERFMRRISLIFVAFAIVFSVVYPIWISTDFEWFFSFSLILIISLSTFAQYYFGITYQMVLNADQRQGIVLLVNMAATVLTTVISVVLIKLGFGIHMVKLGGSIVHVISPIFICVYTRKRYHINRSAAVKGDLIKQRWDAVGHEVANFVNSNTDIVVLTVFSGLSEVSVYTVYHYVIASIRKIVSNFVTGFGAAFGNMYAKGEEKAMRDNLKIYELIVFSVAAVIYSVTFVLITPFAKIYTSGVTDVNYIRPLFGAVLTLAGAFSCFRIPYETIVKAVGHYKQTRNGAFAEAIINITLSVIFVIKFGIVGVAIGTLAAAIFRTFQYSLYMSKNVIKQSISGFLGHIVLTVALFAGVYFVSGIYMTDIGDVWEWVAMAVITTVVAAVMTLAVDVVFYRKDLLALLKKLKSMTLHGKKKG